MLTKIDLNKISNLVDKSLDFKLEPIKKDIKVLKKDVGKIRKDQSIMLDMLDKEQMQQRKRIVRLEEHAGINPQ